MRFTRKLLIPKLCSKIGFDEKHSKFQRGSSYFTNYTYLDSDIDSDCIKTF